MAQLLLCQSHRDLRLLKDSQQTQSGAGQVQVVVCRRRETVMRESRQKWTLMTARNRRGGPFAPKTKHQSLPWYATDSWSLGIVRTESASGHRGWFVKSVHRSFSRSALCFRLIGLALSICQCAISRMSRELPRASSRSRLPTSLFETVYQREATSDERAVCPPQRHMCTVHARVTATCNLARTLSQLSSQSRARNSTVYQRVATSDERAPWPTRRHMRTLHARA